MNVTELNIDINEINEFMQEKEPDYRRRILLWNEVLPVRSFCGDYGMSTRKMNAWLRDHRIQFRANGEWIPAPILERKGYVICRTEEYRGRNGMVYLSPMNYWTPEGQAFLYDVLKSHGIRPLEECSENRISKEKYHA